MLQNTELVRVNICFFNAVDVPGTVAGDGDMGSEQNSSRCSPSWKGGCAAHTYAEVRKRLEHREQVKRGRAQPGPGGCFAHAEDLSEGVTLQVGFEG